MQVTPPSPALVHVAFMGHPPLFVAHGLAGMHVVPLPTYPAVHAQLTPPSPALAHVALGLHPPLFVVHGLTAVHVWPVPE